MAAAPVDQDLREGPAHAGEGAGEQRQAEAECIASELAVRREGRAHHHQGHCGEDQPRRLLQSEQHCEEQHKGWDRAAHDGVKGDGEVHQRPVGAANVHRRE